MAERQSLFKLPINFRVLSVHRGSLSSRPSHRSVENLLAGVNESCTLEGVLFVELGHSPVTREETRCQPKDCRPP